jgi:hypothetical protein
LSLGLARNCPAACVNRGSARKTPSARVWPDFVTGTAESQADEFRENGRDFIKSTRLIFDKVIVPIV